MNLLLILSFISIFLFIYILVVLKIRGMRGFLQKSISSKAFRGQLDSYTGFVFCVEGEFLKDEIEMTRRIFRTIENKDKCILLDLTANGKKDLDLELISDLGIKNIPSLIKINPKEIKEIFNLSNFPLNYTNKQITSEINLMLNRNDN